MAKGNWKEIAQELAGALNACVTQIEQMKGMFDDEDGCIQAALDSADEAEELYCNAEAGQG